MTGFHPTTTVDPKGHLQSMDSLRVTDDLLLRRKTI